MAGPVSYANTPRDENEAKVVELIKVLAAPFLRTQTPTSSCARS
jgi:hypothetical protein